MAVRFIIDSAADIVPAEAEALGLIHLPLKVIFGEEEYSDSVDLTHREFYEKLNKVVPIFVCIIFSILTLCCYFVINFKILKTANVKDVIFLIALILIIFIYRLKNESKIRLLLIISTSLNVIYNFVSVSPLFSTLTYVFEFFANLIAIFIYQVFPSIRNKNRAVIKNTIERA